MDIIKQQKVDFYGDQLTAVLVEVDGKRRVLVPLKPICESLGVAWSPQLRRVNRDPVLSKKLLGVTVTVIPRKGTRSGGKQEMKCLPLEYLNGWLFGINATRVDESIRDTLIRYQEECYTILHEAMQDGRLSTYPAIDELLASGSDAAEAYKIAEAILRLARQQLAIEVHLQNQSEILEDHEIRLEEIESKLADDSVISEAQASQLSQAVKAVAIVLGQQTGRNEFGACYGEIYRKFSITSYRQLPRSKFEEAMVFLTEWHQSLVGDSPF